MIRTLTPAEHRAIYEKERQAFADEYTNGDIDKAEAIYNAFPYYNTPDWETVAHAVDLIRRTAEEAE